MTTIRRWAPIAMLASSVASSAVEAQTPDITRKNLQAHSLSAPGRKAVQVLVHFAPGATAANHNHPGEEIVYVTEGELEYRLEGQQPITLKAGDVLFIPYGVNHEVRNVGAGSAAELATYIVETGKRLVVPAK